VTEKTTEKRLSGWWALISVAVGVVAAVLVGQFSTEGAAEIAGVMAASFTLCTRAFWNLRERAWFTPLVVGWALIHLAALILFIIPMEIGRSKLLLQLIWPEFFAFAGLVWLGDKLGGKTAGR